MREIELTKGYQAIVDDCDYEELSRFKWSVSITKTGKVYVITRSKYEVSGKLRMHRYIASQVYGEIPDGYFVDHINHDTLDNQRANLRLVTNQQNMFNRQKTKSATSRHKGVYWDKQSKKWVASLRKDGKLFRLGYFTDELEAALAYNEAAMRLFGEFAYLNDLTLGYSEALCLPKNQTYT